MVFNFAGASVNICSKHLHANQPVIVTKTGDIIYSSPSYQLEVGAWGYKVNGHTRKWPDINLIEGTFFNDIVTSTEVQSRYSEIVFTKSKYSFKLFGDHLLDGYQFLFRKDSIFLGLPKGSVFVEHEILLNLKDGELISDMVLGNLINTLDAYIQM